MQAPGLLDLYDNSLPSLTPPPGAVHRVIFIRHGESECNRNNTFIGWSDPPLTSLGVREAKDAGRIMRSLGLAHDVVFTSMLRRSIRSAWDILDEMDQHYVPTVASWMLNEQMYGSLTGRNKIETVLKYGKEQVQLWRRSYDVAPPPVRSQRGYFPEGDPKYEGLTDLDAPESWCGSPGTESLKDTQTRVWRLWKDQVAPCIKDGQNVLMCGHGNVLRAMLKRLDNIPKEELSKIDMPRAIPLLYYLDKDLRPVPVPGTRGPMRGVFLAKPSDLRAAVHREKKQVEVSAHRGFRDQVVAEDVPLEQGPQLGGGWTHNREQGRGERNYEPVPPAEGVPEPLVRIAPAVDSNDIIASL